VVLYAPRGRAETLGGRGTVEEPGVADAQELDEQVEAFCTRPLDGGPYTCVWPDALTLKVRERAPVRSTSTD
jgi:putative transposase